MVFLRGAFEIIYMYLSHSLSTLFIRTIDGYWSFYAVAPIPDSVFFLMLKNTVDDVKLRLRWNCQWHFTVLYHQVMEILFGLSWIFICLYISHGSMIDNSEPKVRTLKVKNKNFILMFDILILNACEKQYSKKLFMFFSLPFLFRKMTRSCTCT